MGFIITSLLDKSHLHSYGSDAWGGEGSVAWRARVVLFIGVALMAGGLAGSLVSPCSRLMLGWWLTRPAGAYADRPHPQVCCAGVRPVHLLWRRQRRHERGSLVQVGSKAMYCE